MWGLEDNPHLASTVGSIAILDREPDARRLTTTIANAVAELEPLRQRVSTSPLPFAGPQWVTDTDFDLDHHLRFVRLPPNSPVGALFELATTIVNDPFDRTRPLWTMTLVSGLPSDRSALVTKVHHSIADGQGLVQLALHLFDLVPDAEPKTTIDLRSRLDDLAADDAPTNEALTESIRSRIEELLTMAVAATGSVFGGSGSSAPGPAAALHALASLADDVAGTARVLTGSVVDQPSVSPLWATRSRNRRSAHLVASLPAMRTSAADLGVSLNDLFVVAVAEAALGYHHHAGIELDHVATTVAISTRNDDHPAAHNAVVPCGIVLPGSSATTADRLVEVRRQVGERRTEVAAKEADLAAAATFATLVPARLSAAIAIDHTRGIDFATSNLPGPPVPLWLAGSAVESMHPLGPVAGTAFNATLLSFQDDAAIGLHVDPAAVADAPLLADELRSSLARLGVPSRILTPRVPAPPHP